MRAALENALSTHDALRAVNNREPDSDTNPDAWILWHANEYTAAYDTWSEAMDALAACGYDGSRHPHNFRPWCEAWLETDDLEMVWP